MTASEAPSWVHKMSYYRNNADESGMPVSPSFEDVWRELIAMSKGLTHRIHLKGADDVSLFIVGKPDCYYAVIFNDEDELCSIDNGTGDRTKVALSGEFWPFYETFSDFELLVNIAREFYETGKPYKDAPWRF